MEKITSYNFTNDHSNGDNRENIDNLRTFLKVDHLNGLNFSNYGKKYNVSIGTMQTVFTSNENFTNKIEISKSFEKNIDIFELCLISLFCILIVITVIGNTLIILAVITTRRLRTVTNCFVMSLAVADWLVGIFVMPPAVALEIMGSWQLGWILCDIWISLDVLLCTASILSLCAISIDRYLAVTQPLNYSRRRRSKRLALVMILIVWVLALAITCPPILGWYEPGRRDLVECRYNQNEGYVVFSAMGSFFIPMAVMIYVYLRISCVVASRHDQMTEIEVHKKTKCLHDVNLELEADQETSELDQHTSPRRSHSSEQASNIYVAKELNIDSTSFTISTSKQHNNGHYELVESTSTTLATTKKGTTFNYKVVQKPSEKCLHHQHSIRNININSSTECNVSRNVRIHQKSLSNRISLLKRENKTTQTLSIVVGGFIACWLPFFIYYLLAPFLPHESVSHSFSSFLTWLGWINSAINPFIYAFYSVDFRAAFWRLTLRRFFKNSNKSQFNINTMSIRR